ncbi:hypothetical protein EPA93_42640 [Ktedonosporobacter rubrisoli]|uniref:ribonuclease H n=1 Tax=Ktedonosporobacter rubrisoli TaxID=2509675 RepID=A0A4P6K316_KTERU|nr:RNase H family protein [Ktedonosporobacter rubrisoli]QBD82322.1 hypothetical protein EPA93_42640 [Ktedonosporobacter rubrisoli]
MNIANNSLEWHSVLDVVVDRDLYAILPALDQRGVVAYTDGACIKNPGGPAGWCALLWAAADSENGQMRKGAARFEGYGHIPKAPATTNNRAELAAVLAVLSLAPPGLPLTIFSDSEYTIKVAQGTYRMKANTDLWEIYRKLLSFRASPPIFEWVRGHAGHVHNELADELAGLGAWNGDYAAYEKWREAQTPEARGGLPGAELANLRHQVELLEACFATLAVDNSRVSEPERKFVKDMAKRLRKNNFVPTEKQRGWVKGLVVKYNVR